jgi:hypothetical protein
MNIAKGGVVLRCNRTRIAASAPNALTRRPRASIVHRNDVDHANAANSHASSRTGSAIAADTRSRAVA